VLSLDYFNVDDADISRIESVLIIVGGQIVWSSVERWHAAQAVNRARAAMASPGRGAARRCWSE
jgi:hypothetical protein